jgi:hypothetical protein
MKQHTSYHAAGLLAGCLLSALLALPAVSHGHARLVEPRPRDNSDLYKDPRGPCGVMRNMNQPVTSYRPGQRIQVRFDETVNHPGCFLISFSAANDQNFRLLLNVKHVGTPPQPVPGSPRPYTAMVDLPPGVTCDQCTLQLRQVMLANEALPCPPDPIRSGDSYYSCANLKIESTADMGQPADLAGPADLAMPPAADLAAPEVPKGGCNMGTGGPNPGVVLGPLLGVLALALPRRRRLNRTGT